ncbi:MAG TPA: hypothetical protein VN926_15075 [Bradyrhizobium sp.]|jgi:hypothetical protein|nr:hypothetical protein [Bradyrhizobium sp.]
MESDANHDLAVGLVRLHQPVRGLDVIEAKQPHAALSGRAGIARRRPVADHRQTPEGGQVELVAARRRDTPHGPVANRLWQYIRDQAAEIIPA